MLEVIQSVIEEEESSISAPECGCLPKILVVDDTEFNLMAIRLLLIDNFGIVPEEA